MDDAVAFYRDGIGLPEVGRFHGHDGYDDVFLELPGTLHLGDADSVRDVLARLGFEPVLPANPYWAEHGVTVKDPDGLLGGQERLLCGVLGILLDAEHATAERQISSAVAVVERPRRPPHGRPDRGDSPLIFEL